MRCLQCQHENASDARFCNQCAAPFAPVCAACGHENSADARFCNQCGMALTASPSAPGPAQVMQREAEAESRFHAVLPAVMGLLQRDRRVTYRTLKYVFGLDDARMAEIGEELRLKRLAIDEEGKVLVWTGETPLSVQPGEVAPSQQSTAAAVPISPVSTAPHPHVTATETTTNGPPASLDGAEVALSSDEQVATPQPVRHAPEAERRQLTVMFCDLVGSTDLSGKLDPEDLREVVRAYQEAAAEIIERYEGHIAQYLGDGLLVYFGFPVAHEDDAQRAVYTGLGLPEAIATLNARLEADYGVQLAVRMGIHTGSVVVGEMGGGDRHENLALGETPNIAARLEGLAPPNMAVLSPVTAHLVQRSFVLEKLGPHDLKGVSEPMMLYTVVRPREVGNDESGALMSGGFEALVGRDEEIGLLLRRWDQSREGLGQVVLLSGEAGIGKSSLVEGLRDHVCQAGFTRIAFRCSPYHTNSAFYPIIERVQRALGWQPEDTTNTRLAKLEQTLEPTSLSPGEAVPLLAALLSLPPPVERYPALTLTPPQQRQQTQDVLVAWLLEEAERHPVLTVWEDLHWADPSTLETLGLFVDQAPTAKMLHVLTFRPEFEPPWPPRSHITSVTLNRLERPQVEALVTRLARGKRLPVEVVEHIVSKTDGVPLYVEELTKMLLTSDLLREEAEQYVLTGPLLAIAIPDTLQDSLMARLDQMNTAKEVAQLGSVLGREFTYAMLQAISLQDDETVQSSLTQLVEAELLYQRGRPPRAKYIFKHALVQDTAYASLLRSTRQQYHQRITQVLEEQFPETANTQPELLAHHYTEANLTEQAIAYWQRAGQHASERLANQEAISHFTTGIELLKTLSETPERILQAITLYTALGAALQITKGYAAPEVEQIFNQARVLCQQVGETSQLVPVLYGLWRFYIVRRQFQTAQDLGETLLGLAQPANDPALSVIAHYALGSTSLWRGALLVARQHLAEASAHHTPDQHHLTVFRIGQDPGVACSICAAMTLWLLGYPDQALAHLDDALTLAHALAHPFSLAYARCWATCVYQWCGDVVAVYEQAEAAVALSTEKSFPQWAAHGTLLRGWALAMQGQDKMEMMAQVRQGITARRATGATLNMPYLYTVLVEVCDRLSRTEEGLQALARAHALLEHDEERWWEAEVNRLRGVLLLQQPGRPQAEAETWLQSALDMARHQEAKSLELRAAMSLARLWQSQEKRQEAYDLLAPVYEWFTEGFDTADLRDAKALLDDLEGSR